MRAASVDIDLPFLAACFFNSFLTLSGRITPKTGYFFMANAGEEGQPKPPLPFPLEILVEISVLGSFLYPRNGNLQR